MKELNSNFENIENKKADKVDISVEGKEKFKDLFNDDYEEIDDINNKIDLGNEIVEKIDAKEVFDVMFDDYGNEVEDKNNSDINETKELTDEQKKLIKEETGWSDEIINSISSMEEYEIYKEAGLVEEEINGRKCLVRTDIDWEQKDSMGRTNKERTEQGLPPINKEGKPIELHHIGQHNDSPLAELTSQEHRGKGNDAILHNKTKESEIDRQVFANERSSHWKSRVNKGDD